MKLRIMAILIAVALQAEDAQKPKVVVKCDGDIVCENTGIEQLKQQLAAAQAEIRLYQQGLFQCQAAQIHEQAQKQAHKQ